MTVYVCPIKDIECGDYSANWCSTCPRLAAMAPTTRHYQPVATPHNPEILMPKDPQPASALSLASLPAIGADLDGGTFAGLTTKPDGTHFAVTLLPGNGSDLTWTKAKAWATKQGGELPSRPVAALLFANLKANLQPRWHWTSDEYDASSAWYCRFYYGTQDFILKSFAGSAVAVRLIPLAA